MRHQWFRSKYEILVFAATFFHSFFRFWQFLSAINILFLSMLPMFLLACFFILFSNWDAISIRSNGSAALSAMPRFLIFWSSCIMRASIMVYKYMKSDGNNRLWSKESGNTILFMYGYISANLRNGIHYNEWKLAKVNDAMRTKKQTYISFGTVSIGRAVAIHR